MNTVMNDIIEQTIADEQQPGEVLQTKNQSPCARVFEWLVSPLTEGEFINEIWEQKPYVLSRKNKNYYNEVFKGSDLDALLEFNRFGATEIRVVNNGQQAPGKDYIKANGRIDIGRLSQYYQEGHSIVLHSLENLQPSVAAFTQAMRHFFSARVLVNAYLTPQGSQALSPHFDSHDVFIMQIEGTKNWRLYNSAVTCPLNGSVQPNFTRDQLPEPEKITLRKGDVIYIPRGWVHDAETSQESSLHLTIGIHPTQWVDFISKTLFALSVSHSSLRKAVPFGFLRNGDKMDSIQQEFMQLVDLLKDKRLAENAYSILQHEFIQNENLLPASGLIKSLDTISGITLASIVMKRLYAYSLVSVSNESVSIVFNNSTLQAPLSYIDALNFISESTDEFTVSDLQNIPDSSKVSLVQRLVRDGLLVYRG